MIARFNVDIVVDCKRIRNKGIVVANSLEEAVKKLFYNLRDEEILSLFIETFECVEEDDIYYFDLKEIKDTDIKLSDFVKEVEDNGDSTNDN